MAKRKVLMSNKIYNAINRMLDDMGVMLGQQRGPSRYLPEWEYDNSAKYNNSSNEPEKREPTFIERAFITAFGLDKADKAQADAMAKEAKLAQWKTWQKVMRDRDTKALDKKNDDIAKRHAANNAAYTQAYENTPREIKAVNDAYADISKAGGVTLDAEKAYPFSEKFMAPKDLETLRGISQEFKAIEGLDKSGNLSALTDRLKDIRGQIVTNYTAEYKADPRAFSAKYAENYLANTHNMHESQVPTAIDMHLPVYADKQAFQAAIDSPDAWAATAEKEAHVFRANPVGYIKDNSQRYRDNEQSLAIQKDQSAPAQAQEQDASVVLGKLAEARIMEQNNARYEKELDARIENFTNARSQEMEAAKEQENQAPERTAEPHAQRRVLDKQNQHENQEHTPENERNIER